MKKKKTWKLIGGGIAGITALFIGINQIHHKKTTTTSNTKTNTTIVATVSYGINGLVKYNRVGLDDPGFQNATDSLKLNWFRVPGGTEANYFNPLTDTFPTSPGLKYVKQFVDATHLDIIWDINILTENLETEIEWIEAAAALGCFDRTQPDEPKIEWGNELNQFNYDGKERFPNGTAYADTVARWRAVFIQHFPNMKDAAVGENKNWKNGGTTWNNDVRNVIPGIDLVHHVYPGGKYTHNGICDTAKLGYLLDSAWNHDFGRDHIPASQVWITEFGFGDHDNDPVSELDTLNDDQVLVAVKYCYQHFTNRGHLIIGKHNIVGKNYPAISADKKSAYLLPAGIGIRQFMLSKNVQ